MVNAQVLAIINIQLQPLLWLHVSRVLAIFSSFGDSFSSSSIQASYYDNQNNRGRDEKKQFQLKLHIQASYYDNQNNRGRDEINNFEEMKESIRNDG